MANENKITLTQWYFLIAQSILKLVVKKSWFCSDIFRWKQWETWLLYVFSFFSLSRSGRIISRVDRSPETGVCPARSRASNGDVRIGFRQERFIVVKSRKQLPVIVIVEIKLVRSARGVLVVYGNIGRSRFKRKCGKKGDERIMMLSVNFRSGINNKDTWSFAVSAKQNG